MCLFWEKMCLKITRYVRGQKWPLERSFGDLFHFLSIWFWSETADFKVDETREWVLTWIHHFCNHFNNSSSHLNPVWSSLIRFLSFENNFSKNERENYERNYEHAADKEHKILRITN